LILAPPARAVRNSEAAPDWRSRCYGELVEAREGPRDGGSPLPRNEHDQRSGLHGDVLMQASIQDISAAFGDLLCGVRSREDVADWAARVRAADDAEGIEYDRPTARLEIWNALGFLMGVDLKDGPGSYLHSYHDCEAYWSSTKQGLGGSCTVK
jgi:hypothetical protein